MTRPVLRLATRFTRRTRATAWAIAFACMVLVGALSLVDGFARGVGSVADRVEAGPFVYIHGNELLESSIDSNELGAIPADFLAIRVHPGRLEMNGLSLDVIVVGVETFHDGNVTVDYPLGANDVSLDSGLRARIEGLSQRAVGETGNLTVLGLPLIGLPIVGPPPSRPSLFPDDWVYVRPVLLSSIDLVRGGPRSEERRVGKECRL